MSSEEGSVALIRNTHKYNHVVVAAPMIAVRGGEEGTVVTRSRVVFRPTHLVVPRPAAEHFTILDFKIGKNCQFDGSGGVPAGCFSGDLDAYSLDGDHPSEFLKRVKPDVPLALRLDVATPHHDLALRVQNTSCGAQNFHCAIFGILVE